MRTRRAHAAYYLAFAEAAAPQLTGPEQAAWLRRLESDHDNLRAALRYLLEAGPGEIALELAFMLWTFARTRLLGEGRRWLDETLERAEAAAPAVRAKALHGAGVLAHYQGDYARAEGLCRESLALARESADERAVASALSGCRSGGTDDGRASNRTGDLRRGARDLQAARDRQGIARTLNRLGLAAWHAGDIERFRALAEESLAIFRELEDVEGIGLALLHVGIVALSTGDPAGARPPIEESLAIVRGLGDRRTIAKDAYFLGDAVFGTGDHAAARMLAGRAWACRSSSATAG